MNFKKIVDLSIQSNVNVLNEIISYEEKAVKIGDCIDRIKSGAPITAIIDGIEIDCEGYGSTLIPVLTRNQNKISEIRENLIQNLTFKIPFEEMVDEFCRLKEIDRSKLLVEVTGPEMNPMLDQVETNVPVIPVGKKNTTSKKHEITKSADQVAQLVHDIFEKLGDRVIYKIIKSFDADGKYTGHMVLKGVRYKFKIVALGLIEIDNEFNGTFVPFLTWLMGKLGINGNEINELIRPTKLSESI